LKAEYETDIRLQMQSTFVWHGAEGGTTCLWKSDLPSRVLA